MGDSRPRARAKFQKSSPDGWGIGKFFGWLPWEGRQAEKDPPMVALVHADGGMGEELAFNGQFPRADTAQAGLRRVYPRAPELLIVPRRAQTTYLYQESPIYRCQHWVSRPFIGNLKGSGSRCMACSLHLCLPPPPSPDHTWWVSEKWIVMPRWVNPQTQNP